MPKTARELGDILQEMYSNAKKNEQVIMIYLFGIQFSHDIIRIGVKEVIEQSGIHSSYKTELNKAIKLAKYVTTLSIKKDC